MLNGVESRLYSYLIGTPEVGTEVGSSDGCLICEDCFSCDLIESSDRLFISVGLVVAGDDECEPVAEEERLHVRQAKASTRKKAKVLHEKADTSNVKPNGIVDFGRLPGIERVANR